MARASSTSSKGEVERKSRREEKGEAGGRRAGGGKYDDSLSANATLEDNNIGSQDHTHAGPAAQRHVAGMPVGGSESIIMSMWVEGIRPRVMHQDLKHSGHQNSGHQNSGDQNSGHQHSGHQNSGHQNSGHQNSGHMFFMLFCFLVFHVCLGFTSANPFSLFKSFIISTFQFFNSTF